MISRKNEEDQIKNFIILYLITISNGKTHELCYHFFCSNILLLLKY